VRWRGIWPQMAYLWPGGHRLLALVLPMTLFRSRMCRSALLDTGLGTDYDDDVLVDKFWREVVSLPKFYSRRSE
jgi:hypothetical protein